MPINNKGQYKNEKHNEMDNEEESTRTRTINKNKER
jgi:hypothetical protein